MMLRPGTFLQDRYEILEQIGSGGMSVVYKAKCHKLNRLVAIKVLKEEFCNDANFVSKFKMEAQSAAGLSHPNIVNVYDVIDEGKLHYIVMELIEGITLKSYIAKKGKLEIKESIGIAIQVAQGIAAAHEQRIIHRDIKPQNMMISKDGKVKVADFGIARAVSAQTLNSAAIGSVHYISPEQARGGLSDERTDIYSLGITMYEMVTGRVPYEGENTVSIALAHLEDAMVPPSVYNPEIPVSLERIILKCTEKKPERRYASANDVIADLRKALLQPDGGFVKNTQEKALNGDTVPISDEELAQIKGRSRTAEAEQKRESGRNQNREEDLQSRESQEESAATRRNGHRDMDSEEVNPGFERLLAGAGIIVAIIIVAILIVVFSKLGGLFRSGSGSLKENVTELMSESDVEVSALKDTEVYMPNVLGLSEDLAEAQLKEKNLTMKRTYEYFDDVEKGKIASQNPQEGEVVLKGDHVTVVVSNGSNKLNLSELGISELDGSTAQKFLTSKNLVVNVVEEESETIQKGKILRYEPELVAEGGAVTLYVSSGPHVDTVSVPQLTGKSEADAIALLAEAGLSPGETDVANSDSVEKGFIVSQTQAAGTEVEVGTSVGYVVSSGPAVAVQKQQRYVASISEVYDLSNLIGPGAGSSSVTVMIRLRQGSNDNPSYRVLTNAVTVKGDVLLPVNYTSIESMDGTAEGELEIVDVNSGAILKSYQLNFFPMD